MAAPNSRRTDGPLATITGARDAIRRLKEKNGLGGGMQVWVRGGVYALTEPLVFEPEDSGTFDAPIVYVAYPGEHPALSGGRPITGWRQEGHLWTVSLPEVAEGSWRFSALWVNGAYRRPARTPNEGYFRIVGKAPRCGPDEADQTRNAGFRFKPGDIQPWQDIEDAVVVAMHSWDTSHHRIKDLDETNQVVRFTSAPLWEFGWFDPEQRYYVEHIFEALDQPGEWYVNRKTGVLYYWPVESERLGRTEVTAPKLERLVLFRGDAALGRSVEWIALKGIRFRHTDYTVPPEGITNHQAAVFLPGAIHAQGARHCTVEDCEISCVSCYGIWFGAGCKDSRIVRNHLHTLGGGGIRIGEEAIPADGDAAVVHNVVDNNWIHDGGKIFPAGVGVWIGQSSYNTVSHNEISDLYYTGISVGWTWGYGASAAHHNTIEYNHIHDIGRYVLSDMGGIYTLGIAPGTILRHNVIHDVRSFAYGGGGIYPDEGSTELLIENNLVYNCQSGAFQFHYGRDNRVVNNIFAFSKEEGQVTRHREEDNISFRFERNIVCLDNESPLGGNWSNGNFLMDDNCYWNTSGSELNFADHTFPEWQALGNDQHSIISDPRFRNTGEFDFRLGADSPAVTRLGFRPIDPNHAGLCGDRAWVWAPRRLKRDALSPPPTVIDLKALEYGFEDMAVGYPPDAAHTIGVKGDAAILVTDEQAAAGNHSVKIRDAANLEHSTHPCLIYSPRGFKEGLARTAFDILLGPGASATNKWHNTTSGGPQQAPKIQIAEDGILSAAGRPLMTVPHGQWIHIEIECPLGKNATGTYRLVVTLPNETSRRFEQLPCVYPGFRQLVWFLITSDPQRTTDVYLDNIRLGISKDSDHF